MALLVQAINTIIAPLFLHLSIRSNHPNVASLMSHKRLFASLQCCLYRSRSSCTVSDSMTNIKPTLCLSLQALPQVAAQLMTMKPTSSTTDNDDNDYDEATAFTTTRPNTASIRLLWDAFFAHQPPGEACGRHMDDAGFCPAVEDTTGPTFWIALDPLLVKEGSGLAVLNRTLFHETEPLDVTEDKCRKAIAGATCSMPKKSPHCHAKMEATKLQIDMQPGDAIVWDRFTFHWGVGGTDLIPENDAKQRYSLRYMPKESRAFGAVHPSVEPMAEFNSQYYPQVWPKLLDLEMKALEHGLDSDITLMSALTPSEALRRRSSAHLSCRIALN
jgi:hypothetical protein